MITSNATGEVTVGACEEEVIDIGVDLIFLSLGADLTFTCIYSEILNSSKNSQSMLV